MSVAQQDVTETTATQDRLIGQIIGENNEPTTVLLGCMHGNEPAGLKAIQRVFYALSQRNIAIRGSLYGLIGNVSALQTQQRFIDDDLNRLWETAAVRRLKNDGKTAASSVEHAEQKTLLKAFETIRKRHRGTLHFLDLHTTSSNSAPFAVFGDTLRNRQYALNLHVPIVLGLEESIKGTLVEYLTDLGYVSLAYEAGRHDAPESIEKHEAAIWLALVASGQISKKDVPSYSRHVAVLESSFADIPPIMEVTHRHAIAPGDRFEMEPGFKNFQWVKAGQLLAKEKGVPITAETDGIMLMPLYQGLGEDGFFIARPVRAWWLQISKFMRKMNMDRLIPWLPGVHRHPALTNVYIVKQKIARWYTREVLHLLGFRCEKEQAGRLLVSKRKFDISPLFQ